MTGATEIIMEDLQLLDKFLHSIKAVIKNIFAEISLSE